MTCTHVYMCYAAGEDADSDDEDVRVAKRDFGKSAAAETRLAWAIQALTGGGKNAK